MNILMVGSGKGSWEVRGKQLGRALGARLVSKPSTDDLIWADVAVLVKHAGVKWAKAAHETRTPIVWDALDFWAQPDQNSLDQTQAMALLAARLRTIRPALWIGATEAMASVFDGVYLSHHAWASVSPGPVRPVMFSVGYEGAKKYLGQWHSALAAECARRKWLGVIGPQVVVPMDLRVALRDDPWDGWMCRQWKSGVKLVNAMAAGVPIITQASAAFDEIHPAGGTIEQYGSLSAALDAWESFDSRCAALDHSIEQCQAFTLAAIAERYRQILAMVARRAA